MADIELAYGPGGSAAVLIHSLKALAFKLKLKMEVEVKEDELADALRLHLTPKAGTEASSRLEKALGTGFPVFHGRQTTLSITLDDAHTIVLELPPIETRADYKALIRSFAALVQHCLASEVSEEREGALMGASWVNGRARMVFERAGGTLRWE